MSEASNTNNTNNTNNANNTNNTNNTTNPSSNGIIINPRVFWSRLKEFYSSWKSNSGKGWSGMANNINNNQLSIVDCILIITSSSNDESDDQYSKLATIQLHLFGYEVPDSLLLFSQYPDQLTVLTSGKKCKILEPLNEIEGGVQSMGIKFLVLESNKADKNKENIEKLIKLAKSSKLGKRMGELADKPSINYSSAVLNNSINNDNSSLLYTVWKSMKENGFEFVDISSGISSLLLIKDSTAKSNIEKAAELTTKALKKHLLPELETIIDEEKTVSQAQLADQTDDILKQPTKLGLSNTVFKDSDVDSCYGPIIQSGGIGEGTDFDLKPSAQTANLPLLYDSGTSIIVQLGGRYKQYCSNIGRTYFINPSEQQKQIYLLLTQIYLAAKSCMKSGQKMNSPYLACVKLIQSKKPELLNKFSKNCGFSMGLEFRESYAILNDKNIKLFQKGMIFNLCVGFENLTDNKYNKKYACLLADTMIINDTNIEPESLTKMPREWKDIAYYIGDNIDTTANNNSNNNNNNNDNQNNIDLLDSSVANRTTRNSLNKSVINNNEANEADGKKRSEHQAELARRQREFALQKLAAEHADNSFNNSNNSSSIGLISSYSSIHSYPNNVRRDRIYVDVSAESILLPIGDYLVPFHIATVKNVHKQTEQEFTYLRINFTTVDSKSNLNSSNPNFRYISELTYRTQSNSLDKVFFDIKELRKRVQNRQKELEAKSSLVIQDELKLSKSGIIPTLKDIAIRPLLSRKKTQGMLQAHQNGLRFISSDKLRVDIIYSNIKSAFYQPAEESHQVLLHFELLNPILLDKSKTKKTSFLQFYVEVVEVSEDLSTTNRYRDEDGLLEEQEERRRRKKWNERFLNFVKEVEDKINKLSSAELNGFKLEFDIPYRELSFQGVPAKASVTIMPTVHSLVALEDQPPMVLPLNEVQIAVFERIQFGLKNFDLVFVWKDFNKQPLRIDSIPVKYLDPIKHWLNSCDIVFYESNQNILWKNVMKTINEDIEGFWQDGGWSFLSGENSDGEGGSSDEGGGDSGEEMEEEIIVEGEGGEKITKKVISKKRKNREESSSDFEPSESGSSSEDSEEYETPSEEDSDESDEEMDSEAEQEEAAGEDWDELEAKAQRADVEKRQKQRARGDSDIDSDDQHDKQRPKKKLKPE